MSYFAAQPYKCMKCGHDFKYSPDDGHPAPVLKRDESTPRGVVGYHMPVCPECWTKFLTQHLGLGYCTVDWGFGSDYNNNRKSVV